MSYLSLEMAKKHLNIEDDFTEDDKYIEMLIKAAEKVVSEDICENLNDLENENGEIPESLLFAICLQVGDYYAHRETVVFGRTMNESQVYKHLTKLYRNYSK